MSKSRYVLILARTPQQAAQYARRANLPRFAYRAVSSAGSISGIQVADVHILPGFHLRPDSHAILGKLRYGRDISSFDVEMPEAQAKDQGDGMGPQLSIDDLDQEPPVEVEEAFHEADMAKVEEPEIDLRPKLRRTRCTICGRLAMAPFEAEPAGHDLLAHYPPPTSASGMF